MESIAQSFLNLLVSPPGNLIYHLVLVFAITGTAQAAFAGQSSLRKIQVSRLLIGLGMLLMAQVLLFLASGLSWQGVQPGSYLPILDRGMIAFSLLWITWLWTFPNPQQLADAGTLLSSVVILILVAFSLIAWNSQSNIPPFNTSWFDWGWGAVSIVIALTGIFLLFLRRPASFGIGISMLALILVGFLIHFGWAEAQGNYSAIIRLAQVCAYPLLPSLTHGLHISNRHRSRPLTVPSQAVGTPTTDRLKLLENWLQNQTSPQESSASQSLTRAVAQFLPADICLLARPQEKEGAPIFIDCGFNAAENQFIDPTSIDPIGFPVLGSALSSGELGWVEDDPETTADIRTLGRLIGLKKTSDMLLVPLYSKDQPWAVLMLLSPESLHPWPPETQQRLQSLTGLMVQLLQQPTRDESAASTADDTEKDDIISRLQKEKTEMNEKFIQLQQDILLLGEQLDLPYSNVMSTTERPGPAFTGVNSAANHPWFVQNQQDSDDPGEEKLLDQEKIEKPQQTSDQEVIEETNSLEEPGEVLKADQPDSPVDSESLEEIIARIKKFSQKLSEQSSPPQTIEEELAIELENLMAVQEQSSDLPVEIEQHADSDSKRFEESTPREKISENDLQELERLIAADEAQVPEAATENDSSARIGSIHELIRLSSEETEDQRRKKQITLVKEFPYTLPPAVINLDAVQPVLVQLLLIAGASTPEEGIIHLQAMIRPDELGQKMLTIEVNNPDNPIDKPDEMISTLNIEELIAAQNGSYEIRQQPDNNIIQTILLPLDFNTDLNKS